MLTIEYWSDYACPFCYIGVTNLEKAIALANMEDQVQLEMKSFELDPYASRTYTGPTVTRFARKYGLSEAEAANRIEGISQMGRQAGLDFRYANTRYTNTFDAHRLHELAQKEYPNLVKALNHALYKAYFTDGKELANHEVLMDVAKEVGLDPNRVQQVLDSDEFAQDVRNDETQASLAGVHAVPFFQIGNQIVNGAAAPGDLARVLLSEAAKAQQQSLAGASCSINGCEI